MANPADPREANLPKWAQELIHGLRVRLDSALEPAVEARRKLEQCESRCRRLQDVQSALQELLFSAAKSKYPRKGSTC